MPPFSRPSVIIHAAAQWDASNPAVFTNLVGIVTAIHAPLGNYFFVLGEPVPVTRRIVVVTCFTSAGGLGRLPTLDVAGTQDDLNFSVSTWSLTTHTRADTRASMVVYRIDSPE